jgi:hypothetical protein
MRFMVSKRATDRNGEARIAPQLTPLVVAGGLLIVWAGLCAI